MPDGEPSLAQVARKLQMSPRSLQRRLTDMGTTFRALVTAERHALALRHLSSPALSIAEIAFLLGFSTVPAFHRAFKQWTGLTPLAARRTAASPQNTPSGAFG
ncbi:MAG: helix-turn-helix transcriptional regulator [Polyangiaceae bacterium]